MHQRNFFPLFQKHLGIRLKHVNQPSQPLDKVRKLQKSVTSRRDLQANSREISHSLPMTAFLGFIDSNSILGGNLVSLVLFVCLFIYSFIYFFFGTSFEGWFQECDQTWQIFAMSLVLLEDFTMLQSEEDVWGSSEVEEKHPLDYSRHRCCWMQLGGGGVPPRSASNSLKIQLMQRMIIAAPQVDSWGWWTIGHWWWISKDIYAKSILPSAFKLVANNSSKAQNTCHPGARYCLGAASRWYNSWGATCSWHSYCEVFVTCDNTVTGVAGFSFPDIMELFTLVGSSQHIPVVTQWQWDRL